MSVFKVLAEKRLHKAICKYIKYQHPKAYFLSDPSGLRMSIGMATELKATRSQHKQLDIVILEPSGRYHGLIIEVKKDKSEVYKKDGNFKKDKHVKAQRESMEHLRSFGYKVEYVFSLNDAITLLDNYFALNIEFN